MSTRSLRSFLRQAVSLRSAIETCNMYNTPLEWCRWQDRGFGDQHAVGRSGCDMRWRGVQILLAGFPRFEGRLCFGASGFVLDSCERRR